MLIKDESFFFFMICLGIESTAHTFGCGIIDDKGKILAHQKAMFTLEEGGMIPNEVADFHREHADTVIADALEEAGLDWKEIHIISFAHAPGLSPCLLVGMHKAQDLAAKHNKPLIPVNHSVAHLTIGTLLTKTKDPVYVYVSGPNTQFIALEGKKFRVFGETLDLGLGNAFDKFGREIGLGFPAGPQIEEIAKKGTKLLDIPYVVKGMDVSFAGIITKAAQLFTNGESKEDLCYSLQEICFAMLAEVAERAMAHTEKNELILIGGVAANKRLCEMLDIMCKERNGKFVPVPLQYCGDQGVMIAWQGILQAGDKITEIDIDPYQRVDEVIVTW